MEAVKIRPSRRHGFEKPCPVCGVIFYQHPSDHKTYCSQPCGKIGRRTSRRFIATCQTCGNHFEAIEKLHSNNSNTYCSIECRNIGYQSYTGEKNPNWQGGNRPERHKAMGRLKYKQWRDAVYDRDNYTCRRCGIQDIELQAHHILSWIKNPEERYDINNGMTLCFPCHLQEHNGNFRVDLCQN